MSAAQNRRARCPETSGLTLARPRCRRISTTRRGANQRLVELPLHIRWSGPPVDPGALDELWNVLVLPPRVRRAWAA
jgi:hypothetical protein